MRTRKSTAIVAAGGNEKRLVSIEEAATYLGLEPRSLYNRCAPASENPFPVRTIKIGRRRLFDKADLDTFIESLKAEAGAG